MTKKVLFTCIYLPSRIQFKCRYQEHIRSKISNATFIGSNQFSFGHGITPEVGIFILFLQLDQWRFLKTLT